MTFIANVTDAVTDAIANLSNDEQQALLRHFATNEALKKEKEINKNYKDISAYNPDRFAMQLEDRLRSKLFNNRTVVVSPVVSEDVPDENEAAYALAAKAAKPSKKTK